MPTDTKDPDSQAQGAASEAADQKTGAAGAPEVEGAKKPQQQDRAQTGMLAELVRVREQRAAARSEAESLKARNDELEARLQALEARSERQEAPPAETEGADSAPDYEKWSKRLKAELQAENQAAEAERSFITNVSVAENWLLTRSHLQDDPAAKEEIKGFLAANLQDLKKAPLSTVKAAYLDWCSEKGVLPDVGVAPSSGNAPTGPRPTRTGSASAQRDYGIEDIKRMRAMKPGSPERLALKAEVERAAREGRYKGQVLRI